MDRDYKGMFSKMGEGLLERFIEDLKRELIKNPQDSETLFKLGVAYTRIGKIQEAREVYKKLKEIDKEKAKELLDMIYNF